MSVCIANWNCREILRGCLRSLLGQSQGVRLEVVVHLPGSISSNAPTNVSGGTVWHPKAGERAQLKASSTALDLRPIIFAAAAVVLAVAALVLWRRSRRTRAPA